MNGLIVYRSNPCNIGDYIQSLAASRFFPNIDFYIEREEVSNFHNKEKVFAIMNAWWMWSKNWPPSEDINPLYVSFHVNPNASKWMLNAKGIEHLKKYEPIGCRDTESLEYLKSKNINAYFSGCLTLTLGKTSGYINKGNGSEIIFCDPYYNINIKSLLGLNGWNLSIPFLTYTLIKEKSFFDRIYNNFGYKHKMFNLKNRTIKKIFNYLQLTYFYRVYKELFSEELIKNAIYTTQWIENKGKDDITLLKEADNLVKKYSKAKLIITSRIHCALPSIGCETPVIFISSEELKSRKGTPVGGRLKGLDSFFNIIYYNKKDKFIVSKEFGNLNKNNKIDNSFNLKNKSIYIRYRDELIYRCREFIKNENRL